MEHLTVTANGAKFHVARAGSGKPLLLLHGWPEFWLTWEPVISRLSDRFTLVAPDLRGFGDSDKPGGPYGPDGHAADMLALMDRLGVDRFGVVGHDVGGAVMQPLAP
ncbi:alpha/beta fold hydrolase, partial [Bradyrhizobium yuanmingense]|uniref:alpha/beta fold hydrolase n=1 Tax=Bradyrhizobium yuanmingense TaxID=108015 RepID=UPI00056D922D